MRKTYRIASVRDHYTAEYQTKAHAFAAARVMARALSMDVCIEMTDEFGNHDWTVEYRNGNIALVEM